MIHISQLKISLAAVSKAVPEGSLRCGRLSEEEIRLVMEKAAGKVGIGLDSMENFTVCRRSVDARQKREPAMIYQVEFNCPQEKRLSEKIERDKRSPRREYKHGGKDIVYAKGIVRRRDALPDWMCPKAALMTGSVRERPVVVGMGPAGLFAGLRLAHAGLCPLVIERGSDVDSRQRKVEAFWDNGILDSECNVQFGEGGAGTFSDGKLNTMVKDKGGLGQQVLAAFVHFGAPHEILCQQKPHIGTDLLKDIVRAMREEMIAFGGEVRFDTRLEQIYSRNGKLEAVDVIRADGTVETISCRQLILATGHSARDTVERLRGRGVEMCPKPFAVGVRVEHPQEMIDRNQYGDWQEMLPAADYKLTHTTRQGRGVYSFCMCPGGYVVNASSEQGRLVVNGMSGHARDGVNANSAIVVTVTPQDFGSDDVLAGIAFQREWEEAAYRQGKGSIPLQLFGDFRDNISSTSLGEVNPQLCGKYTLSNVRKALPAFVGDAISEGFLAFERRIAGFAREDALISGIESRTSSPVRILRDVTMQSNIVGLYPCGEGAGYAGGIMSAAMDGLRVAGSIISGNE